MALRQKQAEADAATFQEALEEAAAMHDVSPPAPCCICATNDMQEVVAVYAWRPSL